MFAALKYSQVLVDVVVFVLVNMMHNLRRLEQTPEAIFHDHAMKGVKPLRVGARMRWFRAAILVATATADAEDFEHDDLP